MTGKSGGSSNPLATMLILSAIDVLLCSFTAGIALFLMGDSGVAQAKHAQGGGSLTIDYLFIDVLGVYTGGSGFDINGGPFGFGGGSYRVFWGNVPLKPATGLLKIQAHAEAGCKGKNDETSRWVVECNARDKSDWFADIEAAQTLSLRMTSIVGADSRFCLANVEPGRGVRVFGERPELRLASQTPATPSKDAGKDWEALFDCKPAR